MARFVLIHGSCHGAWCWRDVIPELHALGHEAKAIDLPSHGADTTPAADVTLDLYARAILAALDAPSIVVGHSMAGFPISRAAELDPSHITRLVYLCSYIPWPGLGLADQRRKAPRQPLAEAFQVAPDRITMGFDPSMAQDKFYHDCPEAVEYALQNLCPQPILPQETPAELGANYASVARSYITCDDDQAIPPEFQHEMATALPESDRYSLPSSHSPFFSMPDRLAALLHQIAQT
ncbi:alpha/beta fold hydrolase [Tropicibacter sp. R15_0]|uniref:alpha/beta fold hydrolase n=1 Tax=Tropicibacter sp. R15_0 TaxID=2821101 RepID=UPI001ADB1B36|nr:alpha/beta fold hydrolase [Tropicibacter sp. R15_0]MBO9465505.1 alpha/beta fold hydrolase [Tropicibacter sp. R15_0]